MYCTNLPPCPEPRKPIDGGWGPFGPWSECSATCSSGYRFRRRMCDDPQPLNGGNECPGCSIEFEKCNSQPCPEVQKLGPWTPWLHQISNSTGIGEYFEKRFRYACKLNGTDAKVFKAKEENRICFSDGSCHRVNEEANEIGLGEWSSWSNCTAICGGGEQYREKICERKNCEGMKMTRSCNTHPCAEGLISI